MTRPLADVSTYRREALAGPPTGHTPNGTPYWEFHRVGDADKRYRILGPFPLWPSERAS